MLLERTIRNEKQPHARCTGDSTRGAVEGQLVWTGSFVLCRLASRVLSGTVERRVSSPRATCVSCVLIRVMCDVSCVCRGPCRVRVTSGDWCDVIFTAFRGLCRLWGSVITHNSHNTLTIHNLHVLLCVWVCKSGASAPTTHNTTAQAAQPPVNESKASSSHRHRFLTYNVVLSF